MRRALFGLVFATALYSQVDPLAALKTLATDHSDEEITVEHNTYKPPAQTQVQAPHFIKRDRALNYQCEESIDRYFNNKPVDTITAIVSFERGVEEYRNVRLNGRTIRGIRSAGGARTMMDFGSFGYPDFEWWMSIDDGDAYKIEHTVEAQDNLIVRYSKLASQMPPHIAKAEWGIKYSTAGIPENGWFRVLYDRGNVYMNRMTWSNCKSYQAESKLTWEGAK